MNFNEQIKNIRKSLRLSTTEFAEKLDVTASIISMIEHDKRTPSIKLLEKIKKVYGAKFEI